jgi:hypothetical protein
MEDSSSFPRVQNQILFTQGLFSKIFGAWKFLVSLGPHHNSMEIEEYK